MKDNFTATWRDLATYIGNFAWGDGSFQYLTDLRIVCQTDWHQKVRLMADLLIIPRKFTQTQFTVWMFLGGWAAVRYRLQLHQGLAAPKGGRHSSAVEKLRPRGRFGGWGMHCTAYNATCLFRFRHALTADKSLHSLRHSRQAIMTMSSYDPEEACIMNHERNRYWIFVDSHSMP